ncbi:MAG: phenylalanine--tRNA ligase subunit beta [Saprospirales bacterium]|nr:phenylalanine--tRNA ligase subunit beta [Saprospirales bacterium]
MKVSLNWIREFLDLDKTPEEIADILTSLGLEVEGWDAVKPSPVDLDKVVTGRVLECVRIPDTDHLSATKVDVGDGTIRSIVCGAPNVAAGQYVLVALPGTNVRSKDGQLFEIGERKVRGVPSQGMICAQDELGIGHDHSGIMVLPEGVRLGISAAQYLQLATDVVYEIGLTPNRADATSHLGVARDLLAWVRHHENPQATLRLPAAPPVSVPDPGQGTTIEVHVENTEACSRYTGVLLQGVQVQESPGWLKDRLLALGQRPINNVVDATNYVRLELGQPLHAFDATRIQGNKIRVKTLPAGTIFKSLDEVDRQLSADDLMICDGDSNPMCIGGVFGGATSGVTMGASSVFLESARFNPSWIRRSMLRHNLRTDAAWAFEKGVDPNGCRIALQRAVDLIRQLAGGEIASAVTDIYPKPVEPARIPVEYGRINSLIGENLPPATVKNILAALEIGVESETTAGFTAVAPTNKPDVVREADIVEEILRIYGLDTVAMPAQLRTNMEISPRPDPDAVRNLAADFLAANGFYECMSLSLSNSAYYTGENAPLPFPKEMLVYVHNTANQGLDCLRPSMLFGGLETIRHNQNRQNPDLRLFEFGKTYASPPRPPHEGGSSVLRDAPGKGINSPAPLDEGGMGDAPGKGINSPAPPHMGGPGGASETSRLAIFLTGAHHPESWQPGPKTAVDFYTLKAYVQNLLARLGVSGYQETVVQETRFRVALRYHRGPKEFVTFGRVLPAIAKKMDVKNAVYYADFNFDNILPALAANRIQFQEMNRFPVVRRDLALVLDRGVTFAEIRQLAGKTVKKLLKEVNLFDIFEDDERLGAGKKSYAVSFLFEDPQKTLQDKEIDALLQQLQQVFEQRLNATIRK